MPLCNDNPISQGYTCPKGRSERDRINHGDRLLECQKRVDGKLSPIDTTQALDEIGEKLKQIIAEHGPHSVAVYSGCGGHRTAAGGPWFVGKWLQGTRGFERLADHHQRTDSHQGFIAEARKEIGRTDGDLAVPDVRKQLKACRQDYQDRERR